MFPGTFVSHATTSFSKNEGDVPGSLKAERRTFFERVEKLASEQRSLCSCQRATRERGRERKFA